MNYFFLTYNSKAISMRLLSVLFSLSAIFCSFSINSSESRIERTDLAIGFINESFSLFNSVMATVCENVTGDHFKDFTAFKNCGAMALRRNCNNETFILCLGLIYEFFHTSKVIQRITIYYKINIFNK